MNSKNWFVCILYLIVDSYEGCRPGGAVGFSRLSSCRQIENAMRMTIHWQNEVFLTETTELH